MMRKSKAKEAGQNELGKGDFLDLGDGFDALNQLQVLVKVIWLPSIPLGILI